MKLVDFKYLKILTEANVEHEEESKNVAIPLEVDASPSAEAFVHCLVSDFLYTLTH